MVFRAVGSVSQPPRPPAPARGARRDTVGSSFLPPPTPARCESSELAPRRYPRCSQDGGAGLGLRACESARGGAPAGPACPPPLRAARLARPLASPFPAPPGRGPRLLRPGGPDGSAGGGSSSSSGGASSPAARPRAQRGPRMSPGGGGSDWEQQAVAPRVVKN
ncbi:translation initiation factor IF-2-like [Falco naumanni]|uniref:translation initiation factor IF-2-like n=1 Tax=Falco naumanni TaxID=148594 RepID=UPI001ADE734D|nr:translation initiation factor IF-2-like [Falco naumanni]